MGPDQPFATSHRNAVAGFYLLERGNAIDLG